MRKFGSVIGYKKLFSEIDIFVFWVWLNLRSAILENSAATLRQVMTFAFEHDLLSSLVSMNRRTILQLLKTYHLASELTFQELC